MKLSDKYLKIVEWSEQDQCYVGHCPGLMMAGIHGENEAKVYKELYEVVEEWIEIYEGENLHEQLSIDALRAGESLNSYCM